MLTFDTGSNWGTQKTAEELKQERDERNAELDRIDEENALQKKEDQKKKEAQWAKEAETNKTINDAAEKENRRQEQAVKQQRAKDQRVQQQQRAQQQATNNTNMTEVQKIEAALKAVKKAKQERSNAMQRAARNTVRNTSSNSSSGNTSGTSSSYEAPKPRGRVRVNPVTGALIAVADNANDGKVQEGCLRLDKKYMSAALAAGLGGGNGMYGHMSTIQKQFNQKGNTGGRPRNGPSYGREAAAASTGRSTGKGSMSRVKVENGIATITSKTSNPSRKKLMKNPNFNRRGVGACDLGCNPIRGDQKRKSKVKRIAGRGSTGKKSTGSYMKEKGVVATLGGASSSSTVAYQDKKAKEREAGRRAERLGSKAAPRKPRIQASGGAVGGSSSGAASGDAAARRAARLAALEKRGLA